MATRVSGLGSLTIVGLLTVLVTIACAQGSQDPRLEKVVAAAKAQIGDVEIRGRVFSSNGQPLDGFTVKYYVRELGDVVIGADIEYQQITADREFRIVRRNISSINLWVFKQGFYSEQWSFAFDPTTSADSRHDMEHLVLDFVLQEKPTPAPLVKYEGFLESDSNGAKIVFGVSADRKGGVWVDRGQKQGDITFPYVWLEAMTARGEPLETVGFAIEPHGWNAQGLVKGRVRLLNGGPGDGFAVYDWADATPANREEPMRGMETAPEGGYVPHLEVSAVTGPSNVYFFFHIDGFYGKGLVTGRPVVEEKDGRQAALAVLVMYLNPTGSRDVGYIHN